MRSFRDILSIRKLFALLVALAVLFAPAMTGAASAASPNHDMQMMEAGHCEAPSSSASHHDKMGSKSCCISMCMAVAIAPAAPALDHEVAHAPATFIIPTLHLAYLGEIATPPPRRA